MALFAISAVIRSNLGLDGGFHGQFPQRAQLLQCSSAADAQAAGCTGPGSRSAGPAGTVQPWPIRAAGWVSDHRLAGVRELWRWVCVLCCCVVAVVVHVGGHVGCVFVVSIDGSPRPTKFLSFPYF